MKPKIILVDDDQNILTSVSMALEAEGFDVTAYHEGTRALPIILESPPDLVILDIKMPRMDGREALKKIREHSPVPVIFLTSLDEEADQFMGFEIGADDYITKPFSQKLLIARIHALLRRSQMRETPDHETTPAHNTLIQGHLALDEDRHLCTWKGRNVDVTVTEFLLVKCLAKNPGHVKSREQLMDFAYGDDIYVDDRTVDSHIKRIRKKFKAADDDFDQIDTVYGIGYRFKDE